MRQLCFLISACFIACGGPAHGPQESATAAGPTTIGPNDVVADIRVENTGPANRRHRLRIRAGERTVATELHKFVNPEVVVENAAGIKCWALADPQTDGYRVRTLCSGQAEVSPGKPGGLVAEGIIYCPPMPGKPDRLELRVSEQGIGEVDPEQQYLPVIRVSCPK